MGRCERHKRHSCLNYECRKDQRTAMTRSNLGLSSLNTSGNLSVGLGNGLSIDSTDGSLGVQVAPGLSVDFDFN